MWYRTRIIELTNERTCLTTARNQQAPAADNGQVTCKVCDQRITELTQWLDAYQANTETIADLSAEIDAADAAYTAALHSMQAQSCTSRTLRLVMASILLSLVVSLVWVPATALVVVGCLLIAVSVGVGSYRVYQRNQLAKAEATSYSVRQNALDRMLAIGNRIEGSDSDDLTTHPTTAW